MSKDLEFRKSNSKKENRLFYMIEDLRNEVYDPENEMWNKEPEEQRPTKDCEGFPLPYGGYTTFEMLKEQAMRH